MDMPTSSMQTQQQQQQHRLHRLSIWSYVKLCLLFLLYALILYINSQSTRQLVVKTIAASFPIIVSVYVVRRHKDENVSTNDLISHFVSGAVTWCAIHTIIFIVLHALIPGILMLYRIIVIYFTNPSAADFRTALEMATNETAALNEKYQAINTSNQTQLDALDHELPAFVWAVENKHLPVVMEALSSAIVTFYMVHQALHAVISTHNIVEPVGVRMILNYTSMCMLGLCTTITVSSIPGRMDVNFANPFLKVVVLIGAAMIIALEYVELICFQRRARVARAVGLAFAYNLFNEVMVAVLDFVKSTRDGWWWWCMSLVVSLVRGVVCVMVANAVWKRYVRVVNGKFE